MRRRWVVHVIWLVVALLAFAGGVRLGFGVYGGTLGMMELDSKRFDHLGQVRVSLRLIPDDDIAVHRRSEDMALRSSVISLTSLPRYAPCKPKEAAAMAAARVYLDTHPLDIEKPYPDLYKDGLTFCDKPQTALSSWFFLGL
ncbi:MAG: hypothetical protein ABWX83_04395 [Luteibacter sp.]|jgi:hypothetical protein